MYFRAGLDGCGHLFQVGIDAFLDAVEKVDYAARGVDDRLELGQIEGVDGRAGMLKGLEEGDGVDVAGGRERLLEHHHQTHLVRQVETLPYDGRIRGEFFGCHFVGGVFCQCTV